VYAGAKPFLEKTISILVEGLMDTLLGIFSENKTEALKMVDVNGYCQLMLEVNHFLSMLLFFTRTYSLLKFSWSFVNDFIVLDQEYIIQFIFPLKKITCFPDLSS
jgi:hypothetical protein